MRTLRYPFDSCRCGLWLTVVLTLLCLRTTPALAQETVTLQQALDAARHSNPALAQADSAIEGAQAKKNSARGAYGPTLSLDGSITVWNKETKMSLSGGGDSGFDLTQLPAPSTPYELLIYGLMQGMSAPMTVQEQVTSQVTLTLVQPITPLWSVYKGNQLAELGIDIAKIQKEQTERDVAFSVVTAYIGVLQAQAVHEAIRDSLERVREQLERMKKLKEKELVAPPDVLKVEVVLAQVEQAEVSLRNTVELARANLAVQMGWGIGRPVTPAPLPMTAPILPAASMEQLCTDAENQRIELRLVRSALGQVDLAREMIYQEFIPTVAVMGTLMHMEGSSFQQENSWFVGLNFSWPLWQWGSSYYKFDESSAARRQVEAGYRQARDYVWLEVRKNWLDISSALEEMRVAQRGIDQAEENYRMQKALFEQDYATTSDLLDAESALRQARSQYQVVFWKAVLAGAALSRATGRPVDSWLGVAQGGN